MEINTLTKRPLEIQLTDSDLEHIANGHELVTKISSDEFEKVVLKPSWRNDLRAPLINYDKKLMSQTDLKIRDITRDTFRDFLRNSF